MIKPYTRLKVADNTGAKKAMCIRIPRGGKKQVAKLGQVIVVSIKEALANSNVKKKTVTRAVIIRHKFPFSREDGTVIKFDDNAIVLIDEDLNPLGTRILGPVAREVKKQGFSKIASLAPEIL